MSTYTYNENQIAASGTNYISFVRWTLDDKDITAAEISDEEITALYNQTPSTNDQTTRNWSTAYEAALYLKRKYAKQATFSSAGTSMNLKERAEAWAQIATDIGFKLVQMSGYAPVLYANRPEAYR